MWPNWCVTSNPITATQTDNNVTAEAKVRRFGRWAFTAGKGRTDNQADGSKKCNREEIVILSQLERHSLHLPVFLSNAT